MKSAGYGNAEVQKFVNKSIGGTGFQISTQTLGPETVKKVHAALDTKFGNGPNEPGTKNFSSTSIGPTFGKTVANSAVIAIIASLLVISAYIALRFEWKYAVPVLIALLTLEMGIAVSEYASVLAHQPVAVPGGCGGHGDH